MGRITARSFDVITGAVIGAAMRVHRHAGPGLLESSYEAMLLAAPFSV